MTIKKTIVLLGLVMATATSAGLAHGAAPVRDGPIAARYETVGIDRAGRITRKSDWYLVRTAHRIETAGDGRAEVWERSERGDVSMRRVFRNDQVVLEYHAGDLRAMSMEPEWRALGTVVDRDVLLKLTRTGSRKALGRAVQVYRGSPGRDCVEVWWIEGVSLPALVKRTGELGAYTMKLVEIRESAPAHWPLASHWRTEEFRVVDAADLGDLEHDPVMKRILHSEAAKQLRVTRSHSHH